MYANILDAIRASEIVALADVKPETGSGAFPTGRAYLEHPGRVIRLFKGEAAGPFALRVEVRGKDTQRFDTEGGWLLFLTRDPSAASAWRMTDLTSATPVAREQSRTLAAGMDAYAALAVGPGRSDQAALKAHVMAMLATPLPLLRKDASSEALSIDDWTAAEIDAVIALVRDAEPATRFEGAARANVTTLVMMQADSPRAVAFGVNALAAGDVEAVYSGLRDREKPGLDEILQGLTASREPTARAEAIRLAGMLRDTVLLNRLALDRSVSGNSVLAGALAEARGLAARD